MILLFSHEFDNTWDFHAVYQLEIVTSISKLENWFSDATFIFILFCMTKLFSHLFLEMFIFIFRIFLIHFSCSSFSILFLKYFTNYFILTFLRQSQQIYIFLLSFIPTFSWLSWQENEEEEEEEYGDMSEVNSADVTHSTQPVRPYYLLHYALCYVLSSYLSNKLLCLI